MYVNECKCKCIYVNVNLCKCNQISLLGYLAIYPEYLKTLITYKTYYCFPNINRCICFMFRWQILENTCVHLPKSLQNLKWFVSPHITKTFISIIIIIIIKTKHYQKLERSKFDEIFNESVDSLAKVECYP